MAGGRSGSHASRNAGAAEARTVKACDAKRLFGRVCTRAEFIAIRVTVGDATKSDLAYLASTGIDVSNWDALLKWARKTANNLLREIGEINFLTKVAKASADKKPIEKQTRVAEFVVSKPKQQVGLSGEDGGPVKVALCSLLDEIDGQGLKLPGEDGDERPKT